ncbi:hypothetical protein [Erythrobacter sp.]|uniref:hypothetical protein n=1 Tax=Erythrobacter sp. TaxID=1042 RepID=UPI001425F0C1|nr:hypothetical protein [Erythrobacter sp.]QIQ85745.1 MAG: hypothetical protein G9473_02880 [Erythrobacter sp.]
MPWKGGAFGVKDIARVAQVMECEKAPLGVFLTAEPPTRAMERDPAAVCVWESQYTGLKHPRLQILTLAELCQNKRPDILWVDTSGQKKAKREDTSKQGTLLQECQIRMNPLRRGGRKNSRGLPRNCASERSD